MARTKPKKIKTLSTDIIPNGKANIYLNSEGMFYINLKSAGLKDYFGTEFIEADTQKSVEKEFKALEKDAIETNTETRLVIVIKFGVGGYFASSSAKLKPFSSRSNEIEYDFDIVFEQSFPKGGLKYYYASKSEMLAERLGIETVHGYVKHQEITNASFRNASAIIPYSPEAHEKVKEIKQALWNLCDSMGKFLAQDDIASKILQISSTPMLNTANHHD